MILIPQFRVFLQVVSSQKKQRNQTIISPGFVALFLLLYVKNLSLGTYRRNLFIHVGYKFDGQNVFAVMSLP